MEIIKRISTKRIFFLALLLIYLLVLLKFMVATHHVPSGRLDDYEYNLVPLKTILPYLTGYPNWIVARNNLLGNIILFMPLGFLLALFYRPISWKGILGIAVALSFCIEILQLVLRAGSFDVDDILLNTFGAVVGCGLLAAYLGIMRRFSFEPRQ